MKEPWRYEQEAWQAGLGVVCGCDEAGAGPLAGRLYAAAVVLPPKANLEGLDDSKKLTAAKRDALFLEIQRVALAWAVSWIEPEEIDQLDILNSRMKAMQQAIDALVPAPDFALIDGNRDHGRLCSIRTPHRLLVKGDSLSASIAAASILAKVSRDRYMEGMALLYPGYGFEKHKGYGTREHMAQLRRLGPCPIHRQSFLRKFFAELDQFSLFSDEEAGVGFDCGDDYGLDLELELDLELGLDTELELELEMELEKDPDAGMEQAECQPEGKAGDAGAAQPKKRGRKPGSGKRGRGSRRDGEEDAKGEQST